MTLKYRCTGLWWEGASERGRGSHTCAHYAPCPDLPPSLFLGMQQRPSLDAFLLDEGLTFFLQALYAKRGPPHLLPPMHGLETYGVTIFAPTNDAFLGTYPHTI